MEAVVQRRAFNLKKGLSAPSLSEREWRKKERGWFAAFHSTGWDLHIELGMGSKQIHVKSPQDIENVDVLHGFRMELYKLRGEKV